MLCEVRVPDGTTESLSLPKHAKGSCLLEEVCRRNNLSAEMDYFGLRYVKLGQAYWINLRNPIKEQMSELSISWLDLRVKYFVQHSQLLQPETRHHYFLNVKSNLADGRYHMTYDKSARIAALLLRCEYGKESLTKASAYLQLLRSWSQMTDVEALDRFRSEHARLKGVTSQAAEGILLDEVEEMEMHGAELYPAINSAGAQVWIGVCRDAVRIYGHGMEPIDEYCYSSGLYASTKGKHFHLEIEESYRCYKMTYKLPTSEMAQNTYRTTIEFYSFFTQDAVTDWVLAANQPNNGFSSIASMFHVKRNKCDQNRYHFDITRTKNEVFEHAWRAIAEEKALELQMEFRPSIPPFFPRTVSQLFQDKINPPTPTSKRYQSPDSVASPILRLRSGYLTSDRLKTSQTFNGFFPSVSSASCLMSETLSTSTSEEQPRDSVSFTSVNSKDTVDSAVEFTKAFTSVNSKDTVDSAVEFTKAFTSVNSKDTVDSAVEFTKAFTSVNSKDTVDSAVEFTKAYSTAKQQQVLRNAFFCKICCKKWKNTAFVPCGHMIACMTCALKCVECSECHVDIMRVKRIKYP